MYVYLSKVDNLCISLYKFCYFKNLFNFSFGEEPHSSREVKRKGSIASAPRPILQQLKVGFIGICVELIDR